MDALFVNQWSISNLFKWKEFGGLNLSAMFFDLSWWIKVFFCKEIYINIKEGFHLTNTNTANSY